MWELIEVLWGAYLLTLGLYDARHKSVRNWMLAVGVILLGWSYICGMMDMVYVMQGIVVGSTFIICSYLTKEKIGMGDSLLIGILSMYLGARAVLPILLTAFLMSAIVGVALLMVKFIRKDQEMAFMPFLSIGYWIWQRFYIRHKGVYTVELACIMPVAILIITGVVITAFYLHDKNILYGKVYEVGTIARQMYHSPEGIDVGQLDQFLEDKCKSKLLLFGEFSHDIDIGDEQIVVQASMEKGQKKIAIERIYHINDMEEVIRKIDPVK